MAKGKVEICGVDTSKLPVLKGEQMRELFPRVHAGDVQARHQFIQGNLRLVLSVLQRFHNRGENVDDLFQVGCIGLMKAIDHFDLSIGVRVSRSLRDTAYKALKARDKLACKYGRDPTVGDIAREMQAREEDVVFALEAIQDPVSLYDPVYQDGGDAICVMDQVRDDRVSENDWVRSLSIRQAIAQLGQREQRIIRQRFFGGRTQMEVAQEIGISQAQVSRLEKAALQQMKRYI